MLTWSGQQRRVRQWSGRGRTNTYLLLWTAVTVTPTHLHQHLVRHPTAGVQPLGGSSCSDPSQECPLGSTQENIDHFVFPGTSATGTDSLNTMTPLQPAQPEPPVYGTVPDRQPPRVPQNNHAKENEVCWWYTEKSCRYRISGRRCKYEYPRVCPKLLRHGPSGCMDGHWCEYYQPQLCHSLIHQGVCTRGDCKYTHIKGTRWSKTGRYYEKQTKTWSETMDWKSTTFPRHSWSSAYQQRPTFFRPELFR